MFNISAANIAIADGEIHLTASRSTFSGWVRTSRDPRKNCSADTLVVEQLLRGFDTTLEFNSRLAVGREPLPSATRTRLDVFGAGRNRIRNGIRW
jgi:hypothetical protein